MKKRFLVGLLITSIFLTQCYTTNQYLTKDYKFSKEDDLKKIVLADSTVREFGQNGYSYKVESDSVLITSIPRAEKYGEHTRIITEKDTVRHELIHSVFVSEHSQGKTLVWGGVIGGGIGGLIALAFTENPLFGDPIQGFDKLGPVSIGVGVGAFTGLMLFGIVASIAE